MLTVLLFMLAAAPLPIEPTWHPTTAPPEDAPVVFKEDIQLLPNELRPSNEWETNCYWAAYVGGVAAVALEKWSGNIIAKAILVEAEKFLHDNCRGPGSRELWEKHGRAITFWMGISLHRAKTGPANAPFALPPLPDSAGGDLGDPLLPMFLTLEARLAAGGHQLDEGGRACAWASSALAAAQAVQRTPGATDGIAAGARALEAEQAARCRGAALAQKEAAWAWIRANPGATQPLVVPLRATSAGPALGPADGALWLATALLVLGPEAWPAYLVLLPSAP